MFTFQDIQQNLTSNSRTQRYLLCISSIAKPVGSLSNKQSDQILEETPANRSIGNIGKGFGSFLANRGVCLDRWIRGGFFEEDSGLFAKIGSKLFDQWGEKGITSFMQVNASTYNSEDSSSAHRTFAR